jgi:hypothetical protein
VDLTVPLMPLRDPADMTIYGVDPLWLYEVLASWSVASGGTAYMFEMPEGPAATFTNAIRAYARQVKARGRMYAAIPTAPFATLPAAMAFGDVPADVEPGDEVERTDVSGMFDWMKDAKAIVNMASVNTPALSWTRQSGEEGSRSASEISTPSGHVLRAWNWFYFETNGRLSPQNGGAWARDTAADYTISAPLGGNIPAAWFANVAAFIQVKVSDDAGTSSVYVPAGTAQISGGNLTCTISPATVAAAAMTATGKTEKAYKSGMETETVGDVTTTTGSGWLEILATGAAVWFLELAADYRHPQGTAT